MGGAGSAPSNRDSPTLRRVTAADIPAVERLLASAALPLVGVSAAITTFVVAEHRHEVVGVAGLERCLENGLLRSVVVAPLWRRRGLARALVGQMMRLAAEQKLDAVYLLTTTATDYFRRLGFARISRQAVPDAVAATEEFTSACPASAVVMVRSVPR